MSFPRYGEGKDSGERWLGTVPAHWDVKALKRVCAIVGGSTPKSDVAEFWDGDLIWVTPADLSQLSRFSISDSSRRITQAGLDSCGTTLVPNGSIVLSTRAPIGSIAIAATSLCTNQGCKSLVPKLGTDTRFYAYLLSAATDELNLRGRGTTFLELSADALGSFEVAFPTATEQHLIAAFLDRETAKIDALVEEQKRLIELLKEKRQAVISQAVTKGLDPTTPMKDSGVEWLGPVPAHWVVGSLTRVAYRVVVGIAEAATHAYADEGTPILRSTNIRAGRIVGDILFVTDEFSDDRGSKQIKAGDLVTVRTGNAGVTAVVPSSLDGCQCFTMLITSLTEACLSEFYCYLLNSVSSQRYFSLEGWGTAQVNISVPILKALPVTVPPLAEQKNIVAHLDASTEKLDGLVGEAEAAMTLLGERRAALISAAVTGKIDLRGLIPQPEAAPA